MKYDKGYLLDQSISMKVVASEYEYSNNTHTDSVGEERLKSTHYYYKVEFEYKNELHCR